MSLVPKMVPYRLTQFLLEGVRFGAKSKLTRKGVYCDVYPLSGQ